MTISGTLLADDGLLVVFFISEGIGRLIAFAVKDGNDELVFSAESNTQKFRVNNHLERECLQ